MDSQGLPASSLQVIFFTWPSDGLITGLFPTDVAIRGRQAEFNGLHAARVITCLPPSLPDFDDRTQPWVPRDSEYPALGRRRRYQGMTYPALQALSPAISSRLRRSCG